ncbi:MAG TPA: hypothetical protein VK575_00750 [Gemmatimonadaceae bacterium]|nr:hypothetical protein [Gemmatimonadaceae bacterium]
MTDENDFVMRNANGDVRYTLTLTDKSLMIRRSGGSSPSIFIADITEACELRDWLIEHLDALDRPGGQ